MRSAGPGVGFIQISKDPDFPAGILEKGGELLSKLLVPPHQQGCFHIGVGPFRGQVLIGDQGQLILFDINVFCLEKVDKFVFQGDKSGVAVYRRTGFYDFLARDLAAVLPVHAIVFPYNFISHNRYLSNALQTFPAMHDY